jgi:hypothetical protein
LILWRESSNVCRLREQDIIEFSKIEDEKQAAAAAKRKRPPKRIAKKEDKGDSVFDALLREQVGVTLRALVYRPLAFD